MAYLEVVFLVNDESRAEDITHDDQVSFRIVYCQTIHSKILRQQSICMSLHNILTNMQQS